MYSSSDICFAGSVGLILKSFGTVQICVNVAPSCGDPCIILPRLNRVAVLGLLHCKDNKSSSRPHVDKGQFTVSEQVLSQVRMLEVSKPRQELFEFV
jgi:hypothetical protein